jgi:hypothetical protein
MPYPKVPYVTMPNPCVEETSYWEWFDREYDKWYEEEMGKGRNPGRKGEKEARSVGRSGRSRARAVQTLKPRTHTYKRA